MNCWLKPIYHTLVPQNSLSPLHEAPLQEGGLPQSPQDTKKSLREEPYKSTFTMTNTLSPSLSHPKGCTQNYSWVMSTAWISKSPKAPPTQWQNKDESLQLLQAHQISLILITGLPCAIRPSTECIKMSACKNTFHIVSIPDGNEWFLWWTALSYPCIIPKENVAASSPAAGPELGTQSSHGAGSGTQRSRTMEPGDPFRTPSLSCP